MVPVDDTTYNNNYKSAYLEERSPLLSYPPVEDSKRDDSGKAEARRQQERRVGEDIHQIRLLDLCVGRRLGCRRPHALTAGGGPIVPTRQMTVIFNKSHIVIANFLYEAIGMIFELHLYTLWERYNSLMPEMGKKLINS